MILYTHVHDNYNRHQNIASFPRSGVLPLFGSCESLSRIVMAIRPSAIILPGEKTGANPMRATRPQQLSHLVGPARCRVWQWFRAETPRGKRVTRQSTSRREI